MTAIFVTILFLCADLNPVGAALPADFDATEFGESRYAVLHFASMDRAQVRPGEAFTLAVRFVPFAADDIKFHIYGAETVPPDQFYIPTRIEMDPAPDIKWGEVVFPPGEMHESLSLLNGQPVATIPGRLSEIAAPGTHIFTAKTTFSACTDDICLAPSTVALKWEMEIVAVDYTGEIKTTPVGVLRQPIDVDYHADFSLPERQILGGGLDLGGGENKTVDMVSGSKGSGFDPKLVQVALGTDLPLWEILLFALLGGLVLNVMPCV
ncbi:MAG: hypothetical protein HKM94_03565, partial [Halobacteria archaeon]|nr:hypothetical protein [Halobacteria archaeon]